MHFYPKRWLSLDSNCQIHLSGQAKEVAPGPCQSHASAPQYGQLPVMAHLTSILGINRRFLCASAQPSAEQMEHPVNSNSPSKLQDQISLRSLNPLGGVV
jgi:hypothetical protein